MDPDLPTLWLAAVRRPDVAAALEAVYAAAAHEIALRGPACWASGRCCNFARTGHLLYVTGLEAAYAADRAAPPPTTNDLAAARARGGCPFQAANLCGAHPIKPLGCRLYFCDRSAQAWQHALSERLLADLRALHDRFSIPYRYGEWRTMLEPFL